jgi:general L-amino acid transport system permease protein
MFPKAFWRDLRFLQLLAQVLFIAALAVAAGVLFANVQANLNRLGLAVGYDFLTNPASFDIGESFIPYKASDSYTRAIQVGIVNTLVVSAIGIVLATILGVLAGIARLSTNWLVSQVAGAYVGVFRNTPLIIQLMFWYFSVILQLPAVREAAVLPGSIFLTKRGVYMPWPTATSTYTSWAPFVWFAIISIVLLWVVFFIYARRTGRGVPVYAYLAYLLLPGAILWIGAALQPQSPLEWNIPALSGLNFKGGKTLTPEFTALLVGLAVYTGAFIAEVVRAGIQAVSKGQMEAARSLGLTSGQTLRLVILPQALRVIIPPLTSQYLNLAKNSSLAIAIAYPDLFSIAGTIINQTGAAIEGMMIMMVSYLSMSLFTSLLMNLYNNRVRLVER